jgi:RNA polymerase sigma-70 factor, ECF subfamily
MDPDQNDNDSQLQSATASDAELVAAVSAGDESAFELLFERHRRRVGAIAGRFFQQHQQIEEIVQECFVKAYFALGEFSNYREDSFQSWLARIAFNSCYDELRRRSRSRDSAASKLTPSETESLRSIHAGVEADSLETVAVNRDLANKLLGLLSAEDRLVLVLLDVEGLSVAEIARLMKWSSPKVKIRVFRARRDLRRLLKKYL